MAILTGQNCVNASRVHPRVYHVSYCPRRIAYNAVRMHIALASRYQYSDESAPGESTTKHNNE